MRNAVCVIVLEYWKRRTSTTAPPDYWSRRVNTFDRGHTVDAERLIGRSFGFSVRIARCNSCEFQNCPNKDRLQPHLRQRDLLP